jgi:hypothetical protein
VLLKKQFDRQERALSQVLVVQEQTLERIAELQARIMGMAPGGGASILKASDMAHKRSLDDKPREKQRTKLKKLSVADGARPQPKAPVPPPEPNANGGASPREKAQAADSVVRAREPSDHAADALAEESSNTRQRLGRMATVGLQVAQQPLQAVHAALTGSGRRFTLSTGMKMPSWKTKNAPEGTILSNSLTSIDEQDAVPPEL